VTQISPDGQSKRIIARTGEPNGLAVDRQGTIWVAETRPLAPITGREMSLCWDQSAFVEEGIHSLRKERGFLYERKMPALFKHYEARIRNPLQEFLGALKEGLRVVSSGEDQGRGPDLPQPI
jgi:hypothetical protein